VTNYYCISLEATPERTAHAVEQFTREGVEVTWVWGIDASAMAIKPALWMHSNPDGTNYYITPGACALVLSHYMALRFAERDGCDDFVIFEDDVVLPEGFLGQMEEMKRHCPQDTLAVWLEYCCIDPSRMEKRAHGLHSALPMCTAAVWYKKQAIPIVLKAIQPAYAPVDILIKHRAHELKQLVTNPQMCHQVKYNDTVNSTIHRGLPTQPPEEIQ
jgi:GR25 family glycosyltransferase involved in LPS biosynthesis